MLQTVQCGQCRHLCTAIEGRSVDLRGRSGSTRERLLAPRLGPPLVLASCFFFTIRHLAESGVNCFRTPRLSPCSLLGAHYTPTKSCLPHGLFSTNTLEPIVLKPMLPHLELSRMKGCAAMVMEQTIGVSSEHRAGCGSFRRHADARTIADEVCRPIDWIMLARCGPSVDSPVDPSGRAPCPVDAAQASRSTLPVMVDAWPASSIVADEASRFQATLQVSELIAPFARESMANKPAGIYMRKQATSRLKT